MNKGEDFEWGVSFDAFLKKKAFCLTRIIGWYRGACPYGPFAGNQG